MRNKPTISVILPAYNAMPYLPQAIDSVLSQTYTNFELIIVDDGSTDDSEQCIGSFSDERIRYINNHKNLGVVRSLNRSLESAQGDYIARMDADDRCEPERFERQLEFLESNHSIGVLGSAVKIIDQDGKYLRKGVFPTDNIFICWAMFFSNPIAHPTVMMRTELVRACNGYREVAAEDYDLWERMSHITHFANLPDSLHTLRRYSGTRTAKTRQSLIESSVSISQSLMCAQLNINVPADVVAKLWGRRLESSDDALAISYLIQQIFRSYAPDLPGKSITYIRRDLARRILKIATRENITTLVRGRIFRQAIYYDPLILLRVSVHKLVRAVFV